MELILNHPDGYLFVRRVEKQRIMVVNHELERSFLLAPDRLIENWPIADVGLLDALHVESVLALDPELVLLGTGQHQHFPASAFIAGFLRRGIGIECMDNAAAARTYGLLAGEGRRVVAAFVLPSARSG